MNARSSWIVGLSVVAGCLILALSFGPSAAGDQVPAPSSGRYQMLANTDSKVYVIDTQTGQCWFRHSGYKDEWHDLGSPAIKPQK